MTDSAAPAGTLPAGFEALEPLVAAWAIGSEHERREKRATCSMAQLRAFYELAGPRMPQIAAHLDTLPISQPLTPAERKLFQLGQMYMEVAWAVEFVGAPEEADQVPRERWRIGTVGSAA